MAPFLKVNYWNSYSEVLEASLIDFGFSWWWIVGFSCLKQLLRGWKFVAFKFPSQERILFHFLKYNTCTISMESYIMSYITNGILSLYNFNVEFYFFTIILFYVTLSGVKKAKLGFSIFSWFAMEILDQSINCLVPQFLHLQNGEDSHV